MSRNLKNSDTTNTNTENFESVRVFNFENKKKNIFIAAITAEAEIISAKKLQTVTDHNGNIYPIITSNAIKYNLRKVLEKLYPEDCNRYFDENDGQYKFKNQHFDHKYLDDRIFGFCRMESKNSDSKTAFRGDILVVSPLLGLAPYNNQDDQFFNTYAKKKNHNNIFHTEGYFGHYQNIYALFNDGSLTTDDNKKIIEAIMKNSIVSGNHSLCYESYIFRLSYEISDLLYDSFVLKNDKKVSLNEIFVQKVINNTNDIFNKKRGDCIIIGGEIVYTLDNTTLETLKNIGVIFVNGGTDQLVEVVLQNL